jgi:hypothetical protein
LTGLSAIIQVWWRSDGSTAKGRGLLICFRRIFFRLRTANPCEQTICDMRMVMGSAIRNQRGAQAAIG